MRCRFFILLVFLVLVYSCNNVLKNNKLIDLDKALSYDHSQNKLLNKLYDEYIKNENNFDKIDIANLIVKDYIRTNNGKSIKLLRIIVKSAKKLKYQYGISNTYLNYGSYYLSKKEYDKFKLYEDSCLNSIKLLENNSEINYIKAEILLNKSIKCNDETNYKLFINYADSAMNILKKTKPSKKITNEKIEILKADILLEKIMLNIKLDENSLAKLQIDSALNILVKYNNKLKIAENYANCGLNNIRIKDYDKAAECFEKSIEICNNINEVHVLIPVYSNYGIIKNNKGEIKSALNYYQKGLKLAEAAKNKFVQSNLLNNIGALYVNQEDYNKALFFFNKSLSIRLEQNDSLGIASNLNNIGIINENLGNYSQAKKDFNKSIQFRNKNNKRGLALSIENLGNVYIDEKNYVEALKYFHKSLLINKEIDDKEGISYNLSGLGEIYLNINEIDKALLYANEAYKIAIDIGYVENIRDVTKILDEIYTKKGDHKRARFYFNKYIEMKDSVQKMEIYTLTQNKYFQFEYQKKTIEDSISHLKEIKIKNLAIKSAKEITRKQKIIIYSVALILLIILISSIFLYILYKKKSEINNLLKNKNEEVEIQRDKLDVVNNKLIEKNKQIQDSINYASHIQKNALSPSKILENYFSEYFLIYKPKDIVSGDFYWFNEVDKYLFIVVADCTGHGVPGSLLSMQGISYLNQILNVEKVFEPKEILYKLHSLFVNSSKNGNDDGLEISIIRMDPSKTEIIYSSTNQYLIKIDNNTIEEYNGDIYSIGSTIIADDKIIYTQVNIKIEKGNIIYLMTDGFADQSDFVTKNKIGKNKILEIIKENKQKSLKEQKDIFNNYIENLKNNVSQIDDITILGIKI